MEAQGMSRWGSNFVLTVYNALQSPHLDGFLV